MNVKKKSHVFHFSLNYFVSFQQDLEKMKRLGDAITAQTDYTIAVGIFNQSLTYNIIVRTKM